MFRVTRYPMISKTESGRVGYRKKYGVAGRVQVPAGHWLGAQGGAKEAACFVSWDGSVHTATSSLLPSAPTAGFLEICENRQKQASQVFAAVE